MFARIVWCRRADRDFQFLQSLSDKPSIGMFTAVTRMA